MTGVVVLAAGGTGGHLFPAAALSGELRVRGWGVVLITDSRGERSVEQTPLADVTTHVVRCGTLASGNLLTAVWVVLQIAIGTWQAWWLLYRLQPAVVIGFGGYPSLPTMWAAIQRGIPTIVHEQNAVLGRVNRLLARRVSGVALSLAETGRVPTSKRARVVVTGNPVRTSVRQGRRYAYQAAADDGPFRLLVIGGSQGASIFGKVIPAALSTLPNKLRQRLDVSQQCRAEDIEQVGAIYQASDIKHALGTFFEDIGERLVHAHLVISRAGASSICELACIGRPAVIVPLPHAADDHQSANARVFAHGGAAHVLIQGKQFTADHLGGLISIFMDSPVRLADIAAKARAKGRTDGETALADFTAQIASARENQLSEEQAR